MWNPHFKGKEDVKVEEELFGRIRETGAGERG
jgi:hypothetical protein